MDLDALGPEMVQGGLPVDGVPEHDRVGDQAEGIPLVFLAWAVGFPYFAALSELIPQTGQGANQEDLEAEAARDSFANQSVVAEYIVGHMRLPLAFGQPRS